MYDNNLFHSNSNQESFYINQKLSNLTEDMHNKDRLIMSLNKQIQSLENNKYYFEQLKKQNLCYEEKVRELENENNKNSIFYSEQLKLVSDSENKLRSNLITKDKIIHDINNIIKENDNTICTLRRQIVEKDSFLSSLRQDLSELIAKNKNLSNKILQKDDEYKKMKEKFEQRNFDLTNERNTTSDSLNELKIILNKQNNELNELSQNCMYFENELKGQKSLNQKNQSLIDELTSYNNEYKEQFEILNEIKVKYIENEKYLQTLKFEYDSETQKNINLSRNLNEINEKYQVLKEKYSGENTLENFKSIIDTSQNEIQNLNTTIENITKMNGFNDCKIKDLEKEMTDLVNALNLEFRNLIQWVETYLGVYYESNFELVDLPLTINKTLKNKFKIDSLKDSLSNCRKKINLEYNKLELNNKTLRYEIEENIKNQEKLIDEISYLKKEMLNKDNSIMEMKNNNEMVIKETDKKVDSNIQDKVNLAQKLDNYDKKIHTIEKIITNFLIKNGSDKRVGNSSKFDFNNGNNNFFIDLDVNIQNIIDICQKCLNDLDNLENNPNKSKKPFSPIKSESDHNPKHLEIIKSLQFENELLKKKLDTVELYSKTIIKEKKLENSFQETENKLKETNTQMDRRIINLMRELELKDIQIKSQEQMINRRNKELDEYKSKNYNINDANRTFSSKNNISQNNYYQIATENDYNRDSLGRERNLNLTNSNNLFNANQVYINRELNMTKNSKLEEETSQQINVNILFKKNYENIRNTIRGGHQNPNVQDYTVSDNDNYDKQREYPQEIKGIRSKIRKHNK